MCVPMCARLCACMCAWTCTHVYACVVCVHTYICMSECMCVYMCVYMYSVPKNVCACLCMCLFVCICMYVCVFLRSFIGFHVLWQRIKVWGVCLPSGTLWASRMRQHSRSFSPGLWGSIQADITLWLWRPPPSQRWAVCLPWVWETKQTETQERPN